VSRQALPWLVAGVAAVGLAVVMLGPSRPAHARHPDPRPGVTAAGVLAPAAVPRTVGSVEAYAAARRVPGVLDGLYCYCDCSRHAGHRSLLTCFESDHGAWCDVCMGEALLAEQMAGEGRSLLDIRNAIDRQFGS
jgi:hypothetical protein